MVETRFDKIVVRSKLPTPFASAEAFGAGAGRALQRTGAVMANVADKALVEIDRQKQKDAVNKGMQFENSFDKLRREKVSRYMNTKLSEEFIIEWGKNRKKFSKDQLIDIYMKAKDRETRDLMKNDEVLQFNDEFLEKVNELLTDEDVAVADALFTFYDENYNKINRFYEDKFGTSLGKRPFYSPRSMDRGGINVETGDLRSYAGFSGIKERTAKAGAIKIKGAFKTLNEYGWGGRLMHSGIWINFYWENSVWESM